MPVAAVVVAMVVRWLLAMCARLWDFDKLRLSVALLIVQAHYLPANGSESLKALK